MHKALFDPASFARIAPFASLLLAACASAPFTAQAPAPAVAAAPFAQDAGLVIGTMSYHYAGVPRARQRWVVHFERLDPSTRQDYALAVSVDSDAQRGVFTGELPAGVYAFRDADSAERHYATNGVKMPFEVQAGAVQDVAHYALSPIAAR